MVLGPVAFLMENKFSDKGMTMAENEMAGDKIAWPLSSALSSLDKTTASIVLWHSPHSPPNKQGGRLVRNTLVLSIVI